MVQSSDKKVDVSQINETIKLEPKKETTFLCKIFGWLFKGFC